MESLYQLNCGLLYGSKLTTVTIRIKLISWARVLAPATNSNAGLKSLMSWGWFMLALGPRP